MMENRKLSLLEDFVFKSFIFCKIVYKSTQLIIIVELRINFHGIEIWVIHILAIAFERKIISCNFCNVLPSVGLWDIIVVKKLAFRGWRETKLRVPFTLPVILINVYVDNLASNKHVSSKYAISAKIYEKKGIFWCITFNCNLPKPYWKYVKISLDIMLDILNSFCVLTVELM